jgi:hypothetical protein
VVVATKITKQMPYFSFVINKLKNTTVTFFFAQQTYNVIKQSNSKKIDARDIQTKSFILYSIQTAHMDHIISLDFSKEKKVRTLCSDSIIWGNNHHTQECYCNLVCSKHYQYKINKQNNTS